MKVLLDANVIMTFITGREDKFRNESITVMQKCINGELQGFVAFHTISILWYLLRHCDHEDSLAWLRLVCKSLIVTSVDNARLIEAIDNNQFNDFKDNLQDCCAQHIGADYIVTSNVRHYTGHSTVRAVTPTELLDIIINNEYEINNESSLEIQENHVIYHPIPQTKPFHPHRHIILKENNHHFVMNN